MNKKSLLISGMMTLIGALPLTFLLEMMDIFTVSHSFYVLLILGVALLHLCLLIANFREGQVETLRGSLGLILRKQNPKLFFFAFVARVILILALILTLTIYLVSPW